MTVKIPQPCDGALASLFELHWRRWSKFQRLGRQLMQTIDILHVYGLSPR